MASSSEEPREDENKGLPLVYPLDEFDPEYNPMVEDFINPDFNSYAHGPAKYAPQFKVQSPYSNKYGSSKEEYKETYKLFINRIPAGLNESGLLRIITKSAARPLSVFMKRDLPQGTASRWAFAHFATHRCAQKTIMALHRQPPLSLDVKFALSDQEKDAKAKEMEQQLMFEEERAREIKAREKEIEVNSSVPPSQHGPTFASGAGNSNGKLLSGCGRGMLLPPRTQFTSWPTEPRAGGLIQRAICTLNLNQENNPFSRDSELDYFGCYSGSLNDDATCVIAKTVEQLHREAKSGMYLNQKNRKSYGGRGYTLPENSSERRPGNLDTVVPNTFPAVHFSNMPEKSKALYAPEGHVGRCVFCKRLTPVQCSFCGTCICGHSCLTNHICEAENSGDAPVHAKWKNNYVRQEKSCESPIRRVQPTSNVVKPDFGSGKGLPKQPEDIPCSLIENVFNGIAQYADCHIQSIILSYGEPHLFVCALKNSELQSFHNKLGKPFQDACNLLKENYPYEQEWTPGSMVAVSLESNGWCRGVIDCESSTRGFWHVICCDIGKAVEVPSTDIRYLPEKFKTIPRLSMACSIVETCLPLQEIWEKHVNIGCKVKVNHMTKIPDDDMEIVACLRSENNDTLLGVVKICEWLPLRPPPPVHPLPGSLNLPPQCEVTIKTFCSSNVVYVRPTEGHEDFDVMTQELTMHCHTVPHLEDMPIISTLVGIRSKVDGNFYRGLVTSPASSSTVLVFMIDFGNREEASKEQLYPLTPYFYDILCQASLVRLQDVKDVPLNIDAYCYLNNLLTKEKKLLLNYNETDDSVTLFEEASGVCVNRKLLDALQFTWQKKEGEDEAYDDLLHTYNKKQTANSLLTNEFEVGRRSQYAILHCLGGKYVSCCLASDPLLRYVNTTLVQNIGDYVNQLNDHCYVPSTLELVLAKYDGDGLWYRGFAIATKFDSCEINFIDFYNVAEVLYSNIRKIPKDFLEVPALATLAEFAGVEESDFKENDKLAKRIIQLLIKKSTFEGVVLKKNPTGIAVSMFIPKLFINLVEDNHIPESRAQEIVTKLKKFKILTKIVNALPDDAKSVENLTNFENIHQYQHALHSSSPRSKKQSIVDNISILSLDEDIQIKENEMIQKAESKNLLKFNIDFVPNVTKTENMPSLLDLDCEMNDVTVSLTPETPVKTPDILLPTHPSEILTNDNVEKNHETTSPFSIPEDFVQISTGDVPKVEELLTVVAHEILNKSPTRTKTNKQSNQENIVLTSPMTSTSSVPVQSPNSSESETVAETIIFDDMDISEESDIDSDELTKVLENAKAYKEKLDAEVKRLEELKAKIKKKKYNSH